MNRRGFLKSIGLSLIGVAVAPLVKATSLFSPEPDPLCLLTREMILPRVLQDSFFKAAPFLAYLRKNALVHNGGIELRFPFVDE